jgi:hypothetical protein
LETAGRERPIPAPAADPLAVFADRDEVSPWALDAMAEAVRSGLMHGKNGGVLAPREHATRAEPRS